MFKQEICENPRKSSNWLSVASRSAILSHWDNKCAQCMADLASKGGETHFDHVLNGPHMGGCHHFACNKTWNIAPSCASCNITKGHTDFGIDAVLYHAAVNVWFSRQCNGTIPAIAQELTARFYGKLYSPVAGLEDHMLSFQAVGGAAALSSRHYLMNVGTQYEPVYKVLG